MAVKPSDCKIADQKINEAVSKLETYIDQRLMTEWDSLATSVRFFYTPNDDYVIASKVRNLLTIKYKSVGWKIEFGDHSDPRDGDTSYWVDFSLNT